MVDREMPIDLDVLALFHAAREAAEERTRANDAIPRRARYPFVRWSSPHAGLDAQREYGVSILGDSLRGGNFGRSAEEPAQF